MPDNKKKAKDKRMMARTKAKAAIRAERAGATSQANVFRREAMRLNAESRELMKKK